jgi:hypothetical protein
MSANDTVTRFEIPDEQTRARMAEYRLNGRDRFPTFDYPAKHRSPEATPGVRHHAPGHHATELIPTVGEETRRIDVGQMLVRVPLPQPEARVPAVVVPMPPESAALVTVGLLERVLNGLRKLKVTR